MVRVWSMTLRLILTWSDGGTPVVPQPIGTYHMWLWLFEVGAPWTPLDCSIFKAVWAGSTSQICLPCAFLVPRRARRRSPSRKTSSYAKVMAISVHGRLFG